MSGLSCGAVKPGQRNRCKASSDDRATCFDRPTGHRFRIAGEIRSASWQNAKKLAAQINDEMHTDWNSKQRKDIEQSVRQTSANQSNRNYDADCVFRSLSALHRLLM
jgi:hypothetical protein